MNLDHTLGCCNDNTAEEPCASEFSATCSSACVVASGVDFLETTFDTADAIRFIIFWSGASGVVAGAAGAVETTFATADAIKFISGSVGDTFILLCYNKLI